MAFDLEKKLTPERYYKEIAKLAIIHENDNEWGARCPFHEDKKKSFSVNRATGAWICYGACGEGGGIVKYHARLLKMSEEDALVDLKVILGAERTVPAEQVVANHKRLLENKQLIDFLKKRRGFSLDTIKRFELGFDGDRVWIPVKVGQYYFNVRKYNWRPGGDAREKMLSFDIGYGEARLFPYENLAKEGPLLICEGETDAILANQLGYNAVTVTGGAGTWTTRFTQAVAGKEVSICYDIDEAGHKGSEKVARAIARVCKVKIVHLPITEPANGDFTNYIVDHGYKKADMDELIAKAEVFEFKGKEEIEIDTTVHHVTLGEAAKEKFYLKTIEMPVLVSGKDLAPFFVPHKIKMSCGMGLKKCGGCGLGPNGAGGDVAIEINHPSDVLKMIDVPESIQILMIKQKAGVIPCALPVIKIESAQNVEQVRVIPEIEFASKDAEYVTREIYVLGKGVKTNASYTMRGVTLPDPKTQYATQVISHVEPNQLSIDQFKVTPEIRKKLENFQPAKNQTVRAKLDEIHSDFTHNVTQIYGREDIQRVIDLVYHSVIAFKFLGRSVTKGWCEGLVIGDTRVGKSETIEKMLGHYRCGELVTGENTSYAGLVGGMQQVQNRWSIGWGKIPLADRRLIAIDEASGLSEEHLSLMSGIRSSGIAEIVKIQSERTHARTRIIWAANARSGRRLDSYNYGVIAVKELFGRLEDVARLDIAVSASSGEVPSDISFTMKGKKVAHRYTSDICNSLVLWAWSRTSENIKIPVETERAIFEAVNILDKKYSSSIPLVESSEQRIKLARMSVSLACRLFSTTNGEDVLVKPEHVEEVSRFLQEVFDKPSMGYGAYSAATKKVDSLPEDELKLVATELKDFANWTLLRDILLEAGQFKRNDISDQVGYDQDRTRELFSWMGKRRLIRASAFGYIKHPTFTLLLKQLVNEKEGKPKASAY